MRSSNSSTVRALVGASLVALVVSACGSKEKLAEVVPPSTSVASTSAVATSRSSGTSSAPIATTGTSATTVPTTKANALPDPCVLLDKADAVALAQTDLADGEKAGTPDNMSCTYTGLPTGPTAQVEFFVGDGAKKFLDVDRDLAHEFTDVPGVGDEAYVEDFALFFRVGRRWNVIRLVRLDDFVAYQQPMIDLGTKIAAKG